MKPLTLEELKQMVGKPVWIEFLNNNKKKGQWRIPVFTTTNYFITVGVGGLGISIEDYGKTWLAYSAEPAQIDREAWEPCEKCKSCENCEYVMEHEYNQPCESCIIGMKTDKFSPTGFCVYCGRPLTEEAWEELERRLRGK